MAAGFANESGIFWDDFEVHNSLVVGDGKHVMSAIGGCKDVGLEEAFRAPFFIWLCIRRLLIQPMFGECWDLPFWSNFKELKTCEFVKLHFYTYSVRGVGRGRLISGGQFPLD